MGMTKKDIELWEMARDYAEQVDRDSKLNPASALIQVVVVEPMKTPYVKEIFNDLSAFQEIVDGYIEIINIGKTETGGHLAMTVNEEGKMMNLPFNKRINGRNGSDLIVGTFFITAYNMQGDNVTLTDDECNRLIKRFKGMEVYL